MNIKKFAANLDSWGIPPISFSLREYIDSSVCVCASVYVNDNCLNCSYCTRIVYYCTRYFQSQNGLISTRGIIFHELVGYFSDLEAKKLYSNEPTRVYALTLDHRLLSVIETSTVTRQSNSS